MDENIKSIRRVQQQALAKTLENNGFAVTLLDGREDVLRFLKENIPAGSSVGVGGSATLKECGVIDWLTGNSDYDFIDRYHTDDKKAAFRQALLADVFLMSTNAITMDGMLYNIDGTGNRLAALIYGPDKVYVVAGANKMAADLDDAVRRVETIAAPANCIRLGLDNPCTKAGHCLHCKSETSICNQYVLTRRCNPRGRIHVLLIAEDLGY